MKASNQVTGVLRYTEAGWLVDAVFLDKWVLQFKDKPMRIIVKELE